MRLRWLVFRNLDVSNYSLVLLERRPQMASDPVQVAITATMEEARRAIDEHGVTETAMRRIQTALHKLAQTPGLHDQASLRELHRSGAAAAKLASEGPDGLTLVFARFPPDAPTPIHDHGTWGIAYVIEGHDRYIHWMRLDDGGRPEQAQLRVQYEKALGPGDSVYWFDPPGDIHSQQGQNETAWELVLFGKNALQATRHYFDTATGHVTEAKPQ
jgi:predicted metal-dependent enzyme (double-stranded beta helix superfamily)